MKALALKALALPLAVCLSTAGALPAAEFHDARCEGVRLAIPDEKSGLKFAASAAPKPRPAAAATEVLEVRSGNAVLGLDGATSALVRFADARGELKLAGGSEAVIAMNVTETTRQATLRWDGRSRRVELMPSEVKLLPR